MGIQLNEEETEIFKKRTIIIRSVVTALTIVIIGYWIVEQALGNFVVFSLSYGLLYVLMYVGGLIGCIILLALMPQIHYYYKEESVDTEESE